MALAVRSDATVQSSARDLTFTPVPRARMQLRGLGDDQVLYRVVPCELFISLFGAPRPGIHRIPYQEGFPVPGRDLFFFGLSSGPAREIEARGRRVMVQSIESVTVAVDDQAGRVARLMEQREQGRGELAGDLLGALNAAFRGAGVQFSPGNDNNQ